MAGNSRKLAPSKTSWNKRRNSHSTSNSSSRDPRMSMVMRPTEKNTGPRKNLQSTALMISASRRHLPPVTAAAAATVTAGTLPSSTSINSPLSISSSSSSNEAEVIEKLQDQAKKELSLFSLMFKNISKNSSSNSITFPSVMLVEMIDSIVNSLEIIYKEAKKQDQKNIKEKGIDSTLYDDALRILPTKFPPRKQAKSILAKALIESWFVLKDIPSLQTMRAMRNFDLRLFLGSMKDLEEYSNEQRMEIQDGLASKKSLEVPPEELARKYLEGGGVRPPPGFEFCVKCEHSLTDFPPVNDKIKNENQVARTKYFDLVTHMSEFKAGSRDDPPRDEKGKEIKKIQAPITKHEVISCKCRQNKPDTCHFRCKYEGKQHKFGDCPICRCSCKFLCTVIDFVKIEAAKVEKTMKINTTLGLAKQQAIDFLDRGSCARILAEKSAVNY